MSNVGCQRKCELTPRNVHAEAEHYLDCDIWERIGPWAMPRTSQHRGSVPPRMAAEPRRDAASGPLETVVGIGSVIAYSVALGLLIVVLAAWFGLI